MDNQNQKEVRNSGNQINSKSENEFQNLSSLIDMPQVNLPTGGGAIRGIDEKFNMNAANGTASLTLSLPLSSGRNGFTPLLGLGYNSGAGNSPFGLGWQLNLHSISIKADKLLPKYNSEDMYQFSGLEDLVPYLNKAETGEWEEEQNIEDGYTIKRYRPRTEGDFSRIEKITHKDHGAYWKVTSKNNTTTILGRSSSARIADPEDETRIFQWLVELSYDDKGNWIKYEYKEEDLENVPKLLYEKNRLNGVSYITNKYLKRVQYGNEKAYYPDTENPYDQEDPTLTEDLEKHFFELVFDYGEHHADSPKTTEEDDLAWDYRDDSFSSYRSGFEIRTNRLCKRVLMFHKFDELGEEPCLVKSLELNYEASSINNSGSAETTYLTSAIPSGYIRDEDGAYSKKSMPPMSYEYQQLIWDTSIQEVDKESIVNAPVGLSNNFQWVDLYGEGISGILTEQGGAWYYKQNLGNLDNEGVQFTRAQQVAVTPSIKGLNNGTLAIQDLEANGEKQVIVNSPTIKGYYSIDVNDTSQMNLEAFTTFKSIPNIDWQNPNTRFIDLNGDGRPELVVSEENAFIWYENLGKDGYEKSIKINKLLDEEQGPAIVFSDTTQSIFLADFTGDGLTDIVRIRNGEICYWANKGYGQFSAKIGMSNAPLFDFPDQYNPNYLHLADISGTGATDIIYLGQNEFKAYINHSGNSWSDAHEINPFVQIDNSGKLSVIDLLGTGTSCIVWSGNLPNQNPMQYIDLMSSKKPHVMISYKNNLGKEVKLSYKSSTYFYLKDKREGNPWITNLPFPVQVVETTTIIDHISSSQLSSCYQYHHGYYDCEEREFRGFGMVEQTDQESFETYELTDNLDMDPILTKTWIHTGSYTQQGKFSKQYQQEYYQDDAIDYEFSDSSIEGSSELEYNELQEATRSLKGQTLRQEVYTLDGGDQENIPYTITETNFAVTQVQPQEDNEYGVYLTLGRETLTYNCERNTADPRIAHQFVLDSDEYGYPVKTIQIAYPRRSAITDSYTEQQQLYAVLNTMEYEHETESYYRLGLPTVEKQFEINGLSLDETDGFFTLDDLNTQLANVLDDENILKHDESFSSGVEARLIAWKNNFYEEGDLKALALPAYSEQIIMSTGWALDSFDSKVDDTKMEEAGYIKTDGYWWLKSEKPSYKDADGFYLPYQTEDVFENISSISYDDYNLLPTQATDALENTVTAILDYRTLSIKKVTDINDNVSEAITDELGMVIATTVYGIEDGSDVGDSPISEYAKVSEPDLEDVVTNPLDYLQEATSFFYYHIEAWEEGNLPPHFIQLNREKHVSDLDLGEETEVQISIGYTDGFGRELQSKIKMDESNWLVSGRIVYNNKEKPIKQYEPFVADTYLFQTEEDVSPVGVTPIMYYDPLGRLIKTETPDGFHSKVEFNPWQVSSYDQNDTVTESENYIENSGLIGTSDAKGIALEKAEQHSNTPSTVILDTLGREFMVQQLIEEGEDPLITYTEFDIQGNPLNVTDPRQYEANQSRSEADQVKNFVYTYDLAGNVIRAVSQDAGISYNLKNVVGNPLYVWNARDYQTKITYDALHRPTKTEVFGDDLDITAQKTEYGTDSSKNENGQVLKGCDSSGIIENLSFNFKGQVLKSSRQLCSVYTSEPDWETEADVDMEEDVYYTEISSDALGRVIKTIQADGSVHTPGYHSIGWLKSMEVQLRESSFGTESAASETIFIENIEYDAKGQRTKITYGNGVSTSYTYNEETFRLTGLITKRQELSGTPTTLQDISYIYDPVGNILKITDNSHDKVFTAGQVVDAETEFVYDALYQLKEATGREHMALSKTDYQNDSDTFKSTHFANINDANQLRNYTRKYTYDDSSNLIQIKHTGENSLTRDITVADNSNRAITDEMDTSVDVDNYFDAAGNMKELEHIEGISWNYRNNIASATIIERDSENDAEYYVYDNSGQRVRKVKETYNSDGNLLWIEEKIYLGGVEIKRKYQGESKTLTEDRSTVHIMDDQKRIALVHYWDESNDTSVTTDTNKIHYQLGNHLGSASMELDADGQLISYEEYFPFGGTAFTSGSSATEVKLKEYRYTGKERDDTTGLYYYGARYYAPWIGRWLNPDPVGTAGGLNLFRYVRNNPIRLVDPNGMQDREYAWQRFDPTPNADPFENGANTMQVPIDALYYIRDELFGDLIEMIPKAEKIEREEEQVETGVFILFEGSGSCFVEATPLLLQVAIDTEGRISLQYSATVGISTEILQAGVSSSVEYYEGVTVTDITGVDHSQEITVDLWTPIDLEITRIYSETYSGTGVGVGISAGASDLIAPASISTSANWTTEIYTIQLPESLRFINEFYVGETRFFNLYAHLIPYWIPQSGYNEVSIPPTYHIDGVDYDSSTLEPVSREPSQEEVESIKHCDAIDCVHMRNAYLP